MRMAEDLGYPKNHGAALDFGCSAGRLTQALAACFDSVTGIDISPVMLDLARKHNNFGERCAYRLNTSDDLTQLPSDSFDMVYSRMVLQHLPAHVVCRYLIEFARVLRPSGLALIQLPSRFRPSSFRNRIGYQYGMLLRRKLLRDPNVFEMYGVPRRQVEKVLEQAGARLLAVRPDESAGPEWESFIYALTK